MEVRSTRHFAAICCIPLAIVACSQDDNSHAGENVSATGRTAQSATRRLGLPEARTYVAQFTTKNPDSCFNEVELERPQLEGRPEGLSGPRVAPTRVVVMIDGSGSMAGRVGGVTKLELARSAALGFVDGLPSSVQTSLLVFGQQGNNSAAGKARSCAGLDVLAPMSADRGQLRAALSRVGAVGWTPLAAGLERSQSLLEKPSEPGAQIIYVVSDGEETCGGDPVAVAKRINAGGSRAIVNIIGFGLPTRDAAALKAVAKAGGGDFVNLSSRTELDKIMATLREANRTNGNTLRTSNAVSGNALRTSNAVSSAALCVSNMISEESLRMSNDLSSRSMRGKPLPVEAEARTLLDQRHDALRSKETEFRARLTGQEISSQSRIGKAADAVR